MATRRDLRKDGGSKSGTKLLTVILLVVIISLHVTSVASTSRFHQHLRDVMRSDIESSPVVAPRFRVSPSQRSPSQRFLSETCDEYGCHDDGGRDPQNGRRLVPSPPPPY